MGNLSSHLKSKRDDIDEAMLILADPSLVHSHRLAFDNIKAKIVPVKNHTSGFIFVICN